MGMHKYASLCIKCGRQECRFDPCNSSYDELSWFEWFYNYRIKKRVVNKE